MADVIFNSFKADVLGGVIDLDTDTIKVALVTSAYAPDIDAHKFFSAVTNEVVGTGYTAGGKTLTTPVIAQDDANDRGTFDADDVTWATSTITARGAVVYKDTGVAATSNLIAYLDFVTDKVSSAGDFTITLNAAGLIALT
jgi:hypothetical protein